MPVASATSLTLIRRSSSNILWTFRLYRSSSVKLVRLLEFMVVNYVTFQKQIFNASSVENCSHICENPHNVLLKWLSTNWPCKMAEISMSIFQHVHQHIPHHHLPSSCSGRKPSGNPRSTVKSLYLNYVLLGLIYEINKHHQYH